MKNNKKIAIVFGICFLRIAATENQVSLKAHETWWENFLTHKKAVDVFNFWLGDENAISRVTMRKYIREKGYKSMLDIPCGLCTELIALRKDRSDIEYLGIDITPRLVERNKSLGFNVTQGSIEQIPLPDNAVELCYARHILEHLSYYEKAIKELIRVASKEALIVFFFKPESGKENTTPKENMHGMIGSILYENEYDKDKIERFVLSQSKVRYFEWEELPNTRDVVLHIYVH